jgi:hypothetical protein
MVNKETGSFKVGTTVLQAADNAAPATGPLIVVGCAKMPLNHGQPTNDLEHVLNHMVLKSL